eukprot:4581961-Amphidinium_carterae.1
MDLLLKQSPARVQSRNQPPPHLKSQLSNRDTMKPGSQTLSRQPSIHTMPTTPTPILQPARHGMTGNI